MKPVDVKSSTFIDPDVEDCTPNQSEEAFMIKKVKNTVPWTYVIQDFNGKEVVGTFYGRKLQKTNQSMKLKNQ